MGKILRILVFLLVFFIVVLTAAVIAIPLLVDPNEYKGEIAGMVQSQIGRALEIEGDISLSVFPWLGVEVGTVRLSNPAGFGESAFARIRSAQVRVKLMPLLKKQVEMDTLSLKGLEIHLIRNPDNHGNWDDLVQPAEKGTQTGPGPGLSALAIGGVDLSESRLVWDDRSTGVRYTIDNLALSTGALAPGVPFPIKTTFDLIASEPNMQGRVDVEGMANVDLTTPAVQVNKAKLALSVSGEEIGVDSGNMELTGDIAVNIAEQVLRIDNTVVNLSTSSTAHGWKNANAKLAGDLSLNLREQQARLTGLVLTANISGDPRKQAVENAKATLQGHVEMDLARQTISGKDVKMVTDVNIVSPALQAHGALSGGLTVDLTAPSVTLASARVQVDATSAEAGIKTMRSTLTGKLDVNLKDQAAKFTGLKLVTDITAEKDKLGVTAVRGEIRGDMVYRMADHLLTAGNLAIKTDVDTGDTGIRAGGLITAGVTLNTATSQLKARDLNVTATLTGDTVPGKKLTVTLAANVSADMNAQTFKATDLNLETLNLKVKGGLSGEQIVKAPRLHGAVVIAPFNLRTLLKKLGQNLPVTTDKKALGKASMHAAFSATPTSVELPELQLRLDDTRLAGNINITDLNKPTGVFDLDIDRLNVDRYLSPPENKRPPGRSGQKGKPGGGKPVTRQETAAPLAALGTMDLDGRLRIGRLKVFNLSASEARLKVKAKDGVIHLDPLTTRLYGGTVTQQVTLDTRGRVPKHTLDGRLQNIRIGPLLRDLQGKEKLTGTANVGFDIAAEGLDGQRITETLKGDLQLSVMDGALKGINIGSLVRETRSKIKGEPLPQDNRLQTDFTELSASARIVKGVFTNKDLMAKSPLLRVSGEGTVDLPNDRLDYLVNTSLVETSKGQGGKELRELKGITIPIRFTGSLSAPKYSLDPGRLLREEAKRKVQEKLEKKLQDKLGDELKDKLFKGIFGR